MSKFFIDRPIFAWVISIFIIIAGLFSIRMLPVTQYPPVAPPTIMVIASYPGADAETIDTSVMSLIENQMNGLDGLDYMESKSTANSGILTLTLTTNTDPDMAQVDVQNRLSRVEAKLPAMVKQLGIQVIQRESNFLMVVSMQPESGSMSPEEIADYAARNVVPEIQRLPGVGEAQLFGAEQAMRIQPDPAKLEALNLTYGDIVGAIQAQNIQVSAGALGAQPSEGGTITATITVPGQLTSVAEFENIVVRPNVSGQSVLLKDVAGIYLGAEDYSIYGTLNGLRSVPIGVNLSNDGNASAVSKLVRDKMTELEQYFPAGVTWSVPYDTSIFVDLSISKVFKTLLEAIALVFVVMYVFLQNIRYTLIPTIVVPIALLGTMAVVYALGMSINVLTMFGLVLVIGIVVDDAIVVVENVERIMKEEGLSPREATRKGMTQITGAVVGITVVLVTVFIPMAFFAGSTGNIYRQFSVVMSVAIAFSAFLALTLTPALCATMLKDHSNEKEVKAVRRKTGVMNNFFYHFNRRFNAVESRYDGRVGKLLRRGGRVLAVYVMLIIVAVFVFFRLPTGFLPSEDQGTLITLMQMPPGANLERTAQMVNVYEKIAREQPEVENLVTILGFNFGVGSGESLAMGFITLKDWAEREAGADEVATRLNGLLMRNISDGFGIVVNPPPIPGLGVGAGFEFRLQDRGSMGHAALVDARNQLLGMAMQSEKLVNVRPNGMEDAPQLKVTIDREKAAAQGVSFAAVNSVLSTALGSNYVNDFNNRGRLQQVIVQAPHQNRMQPEDVMKLTVRNDRGQMIPLSSIADAKWEVGMMQGLRFNGYPAMALTGNPAPGYSSGDAIAEMQALAAKLPEGFGYEWSAQSRQEIQAGSQAVYLYAFSILAVFLCLAALYESWSIPLAVILVVPLGFLGTVLGIWGRGMENDVYFQVGLITVIGLSAKNAILIVEFAKDLQAQGKTAYEAALAAAHLRFRPIIMTSLAFILGVVPLFVASGASSASQRAIGTSVFFGMLVGTFLAIFFVPMFYTAVRTFFKDTKRQKERYAQTSADKMSPELAERYIKDAGRHLSEEDKAALRNANKPQKPDDNPDRPA